MLGLDPGLRRTGWGIVDVAGNSIRHVANGTVAPPADAPMAERLAALFEGLCRVIDGFAPDEAAVEETFVNRNAASSLKLGLARGVVLLVPARAGLPVAEYAANRVKRAVVGVGHADKRQIGMMVRTLLPGCNPDGADAADALAVALCHAQYAAGRLGRLRRAAIGADAGATP